ISSVASATCMSSFCSGRAAPDVPGVVFVLHHAFELGLDVSEPADLGPDQGQPCLHELPRMPARALATIPDLEELADILKPQAEPLGVPDEPKPLEGALRVIPVAPPGPARRPEQPHPVVVTARVRA